MSLPGDNLFDYKLDYLAEGEDGKWSLWESIFSKYEIPSDSQYHDIVIPTKDFARALHLSKMLLLNNKHVLTPGIVGSGKTTNAVKLLSKYLDKDYTSISITLSA